MLVTTQIGAQARAEAQASVPAVTIVFGLVRNVSGVAIPGAEVWIEGTNRRVVSNDSGEFRLDSVPSGRVKVLARRVGFRPDSKRVSLAQGDAKQVKFMLEGMLEELDAVVVTAREGASGRLREFWARRMVGIGVFVTRDEINRRHPPQTADLFQGVMGIHVMTRSGNGEPTRIVTGRQAVSAIPRGNSAASNQCPMQYYVDGIFMSPGSFSVDDISPMQIEAVEIFRGPSEVPARFRQRETGCGLVVIWTREPPARSKPDPDDYRLSPRNR
ncbi:MAG: TonB-dependent receptor [Deltaproteobacteria bacterium]